MKNVDIHPAEAWGRSLCYVLLWPLAGYGIAAIMTALGTTPSYASFWLLGAGVSLVVHFIAYFVIGLPIYLAFWKTRPDIWTFRIGLGLGTVAGGLSMVAITILNGSQDYTFDRFLGAFVFGGLYGLVTAVGAIVSRRKNKNEH